MERRVSTQIVRKFDSFINVPTMKDGSPRLEGAVTLSRRPAGTKGTPATIVASSDALIWSEFEWSVMAAAANTQAEGAQDWLNANAQQIEGDAELKALVAGFAAWRQDGAISDAMKLTVGGQPLFKLNSTPAAMKESGMFIPGKTRPASGSYQRKPQASNEVPSADEVKSALNSF